MTLRQRLLAFFYPLIMFLQKRAGARVLTGPADAPAAEPFYELKVTLNDGTVLPLSRFKNKKVVIVNTASDCGYTAQYRELQTLFERYKDQLSIVAFPSNEFKNQEKGSDEAIADFCKTQYGIAFPVARKSAVRKGDRQNEVFQWLTTKEKNGWNSQEPAWNFSKYLVNEQGMLTHYFGSGVSPLSETFLQYIKA